MMGHKIPTRVIKIHNLMNPQLIITLNNNEQPAEFKNCPSKCKPCGGIGYLIPQSNYYKLEGN